MRGVVQDLDGKVLIVELLLLLNKPQQQAAALRARTALSSLLDGDACSPIRPSDDPLQGDQQQAAEPAIAIPDEDTTDDGRSTITFNANIEARTPEATTSTSSARRVVHGCMRALLSPQPMEAIHEALEFVIGTI